MSFANDSCTCSLDSLKRVLAIIADSCDFRTLRWKASTLPAIIFEFYPCELSNNNKFEKTLVEGKGANQNPQNSYNKYLYPSQGLK